MDDRIKNFEPFWDSWYITGELGEGGFGKVYKIERKEFKKTYYAALKHIRVPQSSSEIKTIMSDGMDKQSVAEYFEEAVEDIVEEIELMADLKGNSNVVSYEDHKLIKDEDNISWDIFIRMELLENLTDYLENNEITKRDIIKLGIDMCRALELCQKHNIIHRDIKPENIFVSENGDFKLGDFGIARQVEKTMSGLSKKGTFSYIAPEVYKGEAYGSSVDIYSLGLVMYRLLNNNRMPFMPPYPQPIKHSDRESALVKRIMGTEIPKPINDDGRLAEIVLKACAFEPSQRYSSPHAMRTELEDIMYSEQETGVIYPEGDRAEIHNNSYIDSDDEIIKGENSEEIFDTVEIIPEDDADETVSMNMDELERELEFEDNENEEDEDEEDDFAEDDDSFEGFENETEYDEPMSFIEAFKNLPMLMLEFLRVFFGNLRNDDNGDGEDEESNRGVSSDRDEEPENNAKTTIPWRFAAIFLIALLVGGAGFAAAKTGALDRIKNFISTPIGYKSLGENGNSYYSYTETDGEKAVRINGRETLTAEECNELKEQNFEMVTVEYGIKEIDAFAFSEWSNLKNISIPSSVEKIGDHAFYNCKSLETITLKANLKEITYAAFANCESLESITIPTGVDTIGERAFENCSSLREMSLPDSVVSIKTKAFYGCTALEKISGANVTDVADDAFDYCASFLQKEFNEHNENAESETITENTTDEIDAAYYMATYNNEPLWDFAEEVYSDGSRYTDILKYNNLNLDDFETAGDSIKELKIPVSDTGDLKMAVTAGNIVYSEKFDVGESVWFGCYNNEPIEWQILEKRDDSIFVISKNILFEKRYNEEHTSVTWEKCTLRHWLNNDFYNMAFLGKVREQIVDTTLSNSDNPSFGTEGGNDTTDKIFVLSMSEVNRLYDAGVLDIDDEQWLLRTPAMYGSGVAMARRFTNDNIFNSDSVASYCGVRPALNISY